jgi:hypothetical protein
VRIRYGITPSVGIGESREFRAALEVALIGQLATCLSSSVVSSLHNSDDEPHPLCLFAFLNVGETC